MIHIASTILGNYFTENVWDREGAESSNKAVWENSFPKSELTKVENKADAYPLY